MCLESNRWEGATGNHLAQAPTNPVRIFMLGQIAQGFIQPSVQYPQGQSFQNLLLLSVLARGGDTYLSIRDSFCICTLTWPGIYRSDVNLGFKAVAAGARRRR